MNGSFLADWEGAETAVGGGGETQPFLGEGAAGGKIGPGLFRGAEGVKHGWSAGAALGRVFEVNS